MTRQLFFRTILLALCMSFSLACEALSISRLSQVGIPTVTTGATGITAVPTSTHPAVLSPIAPSASVVPGTGRRSCQESNFSEGMSGLVVTSVRLRHRPYIPRDPDKNWAGSLHQGEIVTVKEIRCRGGVWLLVKRTSGQVGWVKEWSLSEDLVETIFIQPLSDTELTPTPVPR